MESKKADLIEIEKSCGCQGLRDLEKWGDIGQRVQTSS